MLGKSESVQEKVQSRQIAKKEVEAREEGEFEAREEGEVEAREEGEVDAREEGEVDAREEGEVEVKVPPKHRTSDDSRYE
jgi:hypothetical protein